MMIELLYEDNQIIVAYKPKGVLSQADGSDKEDMLTLLKAYIKEKYHKAGNVYLGLVHRLDLFTSGIMVFARTSKAASRLGEQVKNRLIEKKYHAIVEGELTGSATLQCLLTKNEKEKKAYVTSKGQEAILEYQVLSTKQYKENTLTLVDITLKTGRFHQIRAQFSSIGHPLFGDIKYGSQFHMNAFDFPLEAYHLGFYHPVTKKWLTFKKNTLKF